MSTAKHELVPSSSILKVFKEQHPDMAMGAATMEILHNAIQDLGERLMREAQRLAISDGRKNVNTRDMRAAVNIIMPGEFGKHANSEGTRATAKLENK